MDPLMLVLNISLGLIVLYLVLRVRKTPTPLPPGPIGKFLLGNINDLPPVDKPEWAHWGKHKEQYGPISSVTVLGRTIIIISDYRIAVELLDERNANYSNRPILHFAGEMIGWDLSLPLLMDTSRLRSYRKRIRRFIGSKDATPRFHTIQEAETRRFLLRVLEDPKKLEEHIRTGASAIILKVSYGYTSESRGPDPLIELAEKAMFQLSLAASPGKWIVDVIPAIKYLPEWLPGMGFKRIAKQWKRTLQEFTERPYAFTKAQKADGITIPSFTMDNLLSGINSSEEELVLKNAAMSIYGGGSDTIISTVHCFFLAMTLYPEAQKKAQEEIDRVVGADRLPSFKDRTSLPYVEAVVKEVLRWHPVASMGFPHVALRDDIYRGMLIPKGATLVPNIWLFAHDEAYYKDPQPFRPERFLGDAPEMDPRMYCFGFGRRICPGKDFADESTFLTIAMSLAVFNIRKARDDKGNVIEPNVEFGSGIVSKALPFSYEILPRSDEAARLVREVEVDFPWEDSDVAQLNGIKWR